MKKLNFWPLLALFVLVLVIVGFAAGLLELAGVNVSFFLRALSWPVYVVLAFVFCFGLWGAFRAVRGK